jgi:phospholipid transport system substrate-binding protein
VLRHRNATTGQSVVLARITREHSAPLDVSFKLRKTDFGPKIVDINTSGVSLVVTKRAEFDAVIRREGFAALLQLLDAKSGEAQIPSRHRRVSTLAEVVTVIHAGRALLFQ